MDNLLFHRCIMDIGLGQGRGALCWFEGNRRNARAPSGRTLDIHSFAPSSTRWLTIIFAPINCSKLLVLIFIQLLTMAFIDGREKINLFAWYQRARGLGFRIVPEWPDFRAVADCPVKIIYYFRINESEMNQSIPTRCRLLLGLGCTAAQWIRNWDRMFVKHY